MSNQKSSGGCGIGFVLFLIFLILKLVGVIAWSWWWITAPLWIPACIVLVLLLVGVLAVFALKK